MYPATDLYGKPSNDYFGSGSQANPLPSLAGGASTPQRPQTSPTWQQILQAFAGASGRTMPGFGGQFVGMQGAVPQQQGVSNAPVYNIAPQGFIGDQQQGSNDAAEAQEIMQLLGLLAGGAPSAGTTAAANWAGPSGFF